MINLFSEHVLYYQNLQKVRIPRQSMVHKSIKAGFSESRVFNRQSSSLNIYRPSPYEASKSSRQVSKTRSNRWNILVIIYRLIHISRFQWHTQLRGLCCVFLLEHDIKP